MYSPRLILLGGVPLLPHTPELESISTVSFRTILTKPHERNEQMTEHVSIRRSAGTHIRALLLAAAFLSPAPFIMPGVITPAQAQVAVRAEFRDALAPYG